MKDKKLKKKGFTLIELLVVIAIIAILAAVVAPTAFSAIEKSKVSAAESDYKAINTGVLAYYSDTGSWPLNQTSNIDPNLVSGPTASSNITGWNGPYIESWKGKNPWGGTYVYNSGGSIGTIISTSYKYITLTGVPTASITKIDQDLDGAVSGSVGNVRYDNTSGVVYLIISTQ